MDTLKTLKLTVPQIKKRITFLFILFLTCNIYSQTETPKFILASKLYTYKTLALVIRFDRGIDSLNFPIDTTLLKVFTKKLDINGKTISPKKVYYEYRFTAKIDTTYKLPSALIFSNNKSYEIPINEYVVLKKIIKPSKADSLKLIAQKKIDQLEKYKAAEKKRLESKINSRISPKINKQIILLWTDKDVLKINDNFRIVIESNKEFDITRIFKYHLNNLSEKFKIVRSTTSVIYENGSENHYTIFICKALYIGEVTIKPLEIKTEKKTIKTNQWTFNIIE